VVRSDAGAVEESHPGLDPATPLRQLQQPLPRAQPLKVCAAIHHGPSSAGIWRHFAPLSCRQMMASMVRRRS
jgi:hypothetical protein